MKKYLAICGIILLSLVCCKYLWMDGCKNNVETTADTTDSDTVSVGLVLYEPDLSHVTFADTARILDSLYKERERLSTPSTVGVNLGYEIALRLIIDSLETEKTNSVLPENMQSHDCTAFQKEMERFSDITFEYYNKIDSTDRWNSVYTNNDLLEKVIKPHTKEVRQAYKDAIEIYHK